MTPGQPQPAVPATFAFNCFGCKQTIELPLPKPEISNTATVSALFFAHERIPICPNCKQPYMFLIKGLDENNAVIFLYVPLQAKSSGLVQSATEGDIKTAANNQAKAKKMFDELKTGNQIKV